MKEIKFKIMKKKKDFAILMLNPSENEVKLRLYHLKVNA